MKSDPLVFVYVTCPNTRIARQIARLTVSAKLAACANILPAMESIYSWKGRIESARESVLILKTRRSRYQTLEKQIRKLHPYECPCIAQLPLGKVFKPYAKWIRTETSIRTR